MTKKLKDALITKWEITLFDVLDDFQFKFEDVMGASRNLRYKDCVDTLFELRFHKLYTKYLNTKRQAMSSEMIRKMTDGSPELVAWLKDQAEYNFVGLDYPYDDMYHDFFYEFLKGKVIKGSHCEKCIHKIKCQIRGDGDG